MSSFGIQAIVAAVLALLLTGGVLQVRSCWRAEGRDAYIAQQIKATAESQAEADRRAAANLALKDALDQDRLHVNQLVTAYAKNPAAADPCFTADELQLYRALGAADAVPAGRPAAAQLRPAPTR